jgi:hypothetical protein
MKKKIILSLCFALLLLSGCGIFKNRKVHVDKLDSMSNKEETGRVKVEFSQNDTGTIKTIGTVKTISTIHETDSITTETHITPTPGKPFIIDPDGTFHGEAQLVNTKIYKKHFKNKKTVMDKHKQVDEQKRIFSQVIKDSSGTKKQEIHVQKQSKVILAKPNYNWILIVAAIFAFVVAVICLYRKHT